MVTSLKDDQGKIVAYAEWRLVGPSGYEVPNAEYIWVGDMWVHEDYRMMGFVNRLIDEMIRTVPQAKYGYFYRLRHNSKLRLVKREYIERRRQCYDPLFIRRN